MYLAQRHPRRRPRRVTTDAAPPPPPPPRRAAGDRTFQIGGVAGDLERELKRPDRPAKTESERGENRRSIAARLCWSRTPKCARNLQWPSNEREEKVVRARLQTLDREGEFFILFFSSFLPLLASSFLPSFSSCLLLCVRFSFQRIFSLCPSSTHKPTISAN